MITLMKYTYLMKPEKIQKELNNLWNKYQKIINNNSSWEDMNEARAILYLTGQVYCEQIAPDAIERRLHFLKKKISLIEFFCLIDKNSNELKKFQKEKLFRKLEKFYRIIKKYKNKHIKGKYYLEEETFIEKYNKININKNRNMLKINIISSIFGSSPWDVLEDKVQVEYTIVGDL